MTPHIVGGLPLNYNPEDSTVLTTLVRKQTKTRTRECHEENRYIWTLRSTTAYGSIKSIQLQKEKREQLNILLYASEIRTSTVSVNVHIQIILRTRN
jgi:hypothetical protein